MTTLINITKRLALLCLIVGIGSCTVDADQKQLLYSDLIGHWEITVPNGLMFIEFIEGGQALIDDRGALGTPRFTKRYFDDYIISRANEVDFSMGATMQDVIIQGDRMTFTFVNDDTNHATPYVATKIKMPSKDSRTKVLTQPWITVEENGNTLIGNDRKIVHFSEAGIYFIKSFDLDDIELFKWNWDTSVTFNRFCYTTYQRPTNPQQEACISVLEFSDTEVLLEIDGSIVRMSALASR